MNNREVSIGKEGMEFAKVDNRAEANGPKVIEFGEVVEIYFGDLLNAVTNDPEHWVETFVSERREANVSLLNKLLVRPEVLAKYMAKIEATPILVTAYNRLNNKQDFLIEEVVMHGLGILTDEQLAVLSVDVIRLRNLSDFLDELLDCAECGDVWFDEILSD